LLLAGLLTACATTEPLVSHADSTPVPVPVEQPCPPAADQIPVPPKSRAVPNGTALQNVAAMDAYARESRLYQQDAAAIFAKCQKESP